ncbi:MAG: hypothetical protein KID00_05545 [Clostridium argentinense]|uniref:Lantibiotic n=1 Tax=Clostridium faecium TaxID=2762223 RepID=A0ABR8YVU0_9CLOT|nr:MULTISPECIES: hypothetical protein [Clostridium]MBD8048252.1 hypothetical protein [Clostridium faecium]MBS5823314.1 hypothetical protein [Clostridium argentinense]
MSDINKEVLNEKELLDELLEDELLEEKDTVESEGDFQEGYRNNSNCGLTKIYSKSVNIWINCCRK